jgi:hypothetical protein
VPVRETAGAVVPLPWAEIVSVLVGKSKGAGNAGMLVETVMAKRFAIGLAVQLFTRHPRPKVCCRDASSE